MYIEAGQKCYKSYIGLYFNVDYLFKVNGSYGKTVCIGYNHLVIIIGYTIVEAV